jgi:hypothetical protein
MAETTNAGAAPQPPQQQASPQLTVYQAGGMRKVIFAFLFLLLLPFFVSLPVMLYQRFTKGVLLDTWGLVVLAIGFAVIMLLLLFELIFSLRARIVLGEKGIRLSLPAARFGLPAFSYRRAEIPYDQIAAVETRRVVYGGSIAPVLMREAWIVTKDGTQHSLGTVSEADTDPQFPVKDIAERLCGNCGVGLAERDGSWRRIARLFGKAEEAGAPVTEEMVARLNRNHNRFMLGLVAVMVLLLAAGLAIDFATGDIDRGERARDAVQTQPAKGQPVKK